MQHTKTKIYNFKNYQWIETYNFREKNEKWTNKMDRSEKWKNDRFFKNEQKTNKKERFKVVWPNFKLSFCLLKKRIFKKKKNIFSYWTNDFMEQTFKKTIVFFYGTLFFFYKFLKKNKVFIWTVNFILNERFFWTKDVFKDLNIYQKN